MKYPGLGIGDEYGNCIYMFTYEKIYYWLVNHPEIPACKKYLELYPNFIKDFDSSTLVG
jgi:hypothetical protein